MKGRRQQGEKEGGGGVGGTQDRDTGMDQAKKKEKIRQGIDIKKPQQRFPSCGARDAVEQTNRQSINELPTCSCY